DAADGDMDGIAGEKFFGTVRERFEIEREAAVFELIPFVGGIDAGGGSGGGGSWRGRRGGLRAQDAWEKQKKCDEKAARERHGEAHFPAGLAACGWRMAVTFLA